jgi:hypothetical protein
MHPIIPFAALHVIPLWVLVIQSTWVSTSFCSDFPWLFYLVASLAGVAFSMASNAFRVRPLTTNQTDETYTGVLPICSVCHLHMFPRTFHCSICGCCSEHQIGHIISSGACISQRSSLFVFFGVWASWLYHAYVILETVASLFQWEPLLPYVCGRFLLVSQLVPIGWTFVQLSIFSVQFAQIALTNAIILESKRVLGFEVFLLQDRQRNPYDIGVMQNLPDFWQPVRGGAWPALRPGEVTDAYCEDILKYRGLDLKPTIVTEQASVETMAPESCS